MNLAWNRPRQYPAANESRIGKARTQSPLSLDEQAKKPALISRHQFMSPRSIERILRKYIHNAQTPSTMQYPSRTEFAMTTRKENETNVPKKTQIYAPVLNNDFACATALFQYPQPFDAYPEFTILGW